MLDISKEINQPEPVRIFCGVNNIHTIDSLLPVTE
jgi:hypothetical protein